MSSSDYLFSEDDILSITSIPEEQSSPFHLNISPMSHGPDNSLVNTVIINQKKLPLNQTNKSPINSSGAALNFFNSLSLNKKENINTKNAQKDPLSVTKTAAATVGAKSSISKGKSPSPPFSSHIHKGNSLPTMTNTAALTYTDATQREHLPTTAICTNAAAATNTDTDLRDAKLSDAMGNFPSLTHSDSTEKNISSSTKIGLDAFSPPSYTHKQLNKATETKLESCSRSPALANSDTHLNKANDIDSGEIFSPLIQINESKQEERPSTTANAFWSIFNQKPDVSKLSLSKKPTTRCVNIGKRSIPPHQSNASLRPDAQGDLKSKLKNSAMPTVVNSTKARTLSRPAAKRDLFNSPFRSPDEQPISFSKVVAGTGPVLVAPSVPAPITKTPAKRTNDDLDCSSFKTPVKRLRATSNFKSPNIFPPLTTPVFQSKAAKSVYEESKTRNRPSHQPLPCSINAPSHSAATPPPQNIDAELPPWKLVPQSRRAPPILVNDVKEIVPLLEKLNYTAGISSYTTRAIEGNGVRIQAKDMTAYHKIKNVLIANGFPLFTNQPKSERGFRVVIRHLHHSTPCSWIVDELLKLGFSARFVRNMTNPATGGPMRMFEVEIVMAKDGSHDKIISLKQIGGQKVDIERKNRTREPVQCYRCQGYRHAKNSCMRPPKCMKCAGDHLSSCCTKPRTTPATCVNCSGEHISAYKGCPVYKAEKQKLAANNIDTNNIRTIKDATNNFYRRQGPPPRNNTPRLPHSTAILSRSIAEARQEAARKSMSNPFRQNINDRRPRFSSHDTAIQMRLNKWRRNSNNIPKKGRKSSKNNAKPRLVPKTSNPAQKHLENYQDMLRKQRSEKNDQEPEKGTSNPTQFGNDSPPTTSRAARASFKPRIIEEATPSPRNSNPYLQKGFSDDPTRNLANRVDNLEKKIDSLLALIIQGTDNNLDMDTSN